ncbi:MAG: DNA gyrase subunit B, partial [Candidatus Paceibacteria bacterium]
IKKGKSHQYIKNEHEFVKVMVKRASEGLIIRYGEGAAKLEGAALTKFITVLNEYLGFLDKLNKRLREEQITSLLPKLDLAKRADFEGDKNTPPKKIEKLEKELKRRQKDLKLKTVETRFDEEHNLWELIFVNAQGAEHVISWELASTPECRQLITKFKQIEQYLEPPFVVESVPRPAKTKTSAEDKDEDKNEEEGDSDTNQDESLSAAEKEEAEKAQKKSGKPPARRAKEPEIVEKNTARELFDYVLNEGRKEYIVQRYKGLGEMTAEQLWETTMDPERRTLLQVRLEDIAECETIFTTLMGEDVEVRRKFIEENALDVKNLDV